MGTVVVDLKHFDYQYAAQDWHRDQAEQFQQLSEIQTDNTVVDGQIVETVETTKEYASALATVAANPITGPPYFYQDGNYHADPAYIFQKTHIITTTFQDFSDTSYDITIDDYDVLNNTHKVTHLSVDGKIPLAPTQGSLLSNLIQRPIVGTLIDTCQDFSDVKSALNFAWAEDVDELSRAARRQSQRDSAVPRVVTMRSNPLIRMFMTGQLIDPSRGINRLCIVAGRTLKHDSATANGSMDLTLEDWMR